MVDTVFPADVKVLQARIRALAAEP